MSGPEELIERLRGLDLKALALDELNALLREVRILLGGDKANRALDLEERVRVLRVWHILVLLGADAGIQEDQEDQDEGDPSSVAPEAVTQAPENADEMPVASLDAITDPVVLLHEHQDEPDGEAMAYGPYQLVEFPAFATGVHPEDIMSSEMKDAPSKTYDAQQRMRLRLVKQGTLMNRLLPAGTIVLVYPLDGQHLLDQGIAERLPLGFAPEAERTSDMQES